MVDRKDLLGLLNERRSFVTLVNDSVEPDNKAEAMLGLLTHDTATIHLFNDDSDMFRSIKFLRGRSLDAVDFMASYSEAMQNRDIYANSYLEKIFHRQIVYDCEKELIDSLVAIHNHIKELKPALKEFRQNNQSSNDLSTVSDQLYSTLQMSDKALANYLTQLINKDAHYEIKR